jgi:AAT family amino acid transporter
MIVMYLSWVLVKNIVVPIPAPASLDLLNESTPLIPHDAGAPHHHSRVYDIVDIQTIDLYSDEYPDDPVDAVEDETKETRFQLFWKLYNMLA